MIPLTGKWAGFFTQKFDFNKDKSFEFYFEMDIEVSEDGFQGTCFDFEIEKGKKERSLIKGFIEGKMISFIKTYQNTILYDKETEELVLVKGNRQEEINYYGNYEPDNEKYSGTWEISEVDRVEFDNVFEYIESGYWEMKKIV